MPDTPEKQAVDGATAEGNMARMRGETNANCPYPAIGGLIGDQRTAWLNALKGSK